MPHFDYVIIGSGQALGTLLGYLGTTGESIAIIEGDRVGGTCVNTGCTPTKALVASAKVAHTVRRASEYGIQTSAIGVDFAAVRARMNGIRDNRGMVSWIEGMKDVTLIRGWAEFDGPRSVRVGDDQITGGQIYINAGTHPRTPDVPGLDGVPWLDNARLLDLEELPEHLIILGGSYIGLEFGQIFRRFGARVSIIERGTRLVGREDDDVSDAVREILEGEGIEVLLDAGVVRVDPADRGVSLTVSQSGEERTIEGSHLLVAVGRIPNSGALGLQTAGIEVGERGYIVVDDHCRTTAEGVFALGDINGQGAFTHTSVNDAEIVLDTMRGGTRTLSQRIVSYGLFIDPALGRVGMTERQAVQSGRTVMTARRAMKRISRAKEMGETQGFAKLIVDADTDQILGASILGPGGDEIINMIAAFMTTGQPCTTFRRSVLAHPTISELMPWILDDLTLVDA